MNDIDRMLLIARLRNPSVEAFLVHLEQQYPGIAAGGDVTVNKLWLCGLWLKACEAEREAAARRPCKVRRRSASAYNGDMGTRKTDEQVYAERICTELRSRPPEQWAAVITAALEVIVADEREACARRLEAACVRWPDDPQIRAVLRGEAEAVRAGSD